MGRRSCSLRPESARGRVMMALPVDVADLCPRSGDVEAPSKPRSSLSCMAEAEPELLGRARRRSFGRGQGGVRPHGVGRSGVRRLLGPSPSPSPGSGGAEFAVFRGLSPSPSPGSGGAVFAFFQGLSPSPSPGSGGAEFAVFRGLSPSPSPGSGGAEFAVFRGLARVRALGRAELLMAPLVRPDCLSVSLCQVALCVKCSCNSVGRRGDLVRVAS
jgi:hypothetical protein